MIPPLPRPQPAKFDDSKALVERIEHVERPPIQVAKSSKFRKQRPTYVPRPGFQPANLRMPPLIQSEELTKHQTKDDACGSTY